MNVINYNVHAIPLNKIEKTILKFIMCIELVHPVQQFYYPKKEYYLY